MGDGYACRVPGYSWFCGDAHAAAVIVAGVAVRSTPLFRRLAGEILVVGFRVIAPLIAANVPNLAAQPRQSATPAGRRRVRKGNEYVTAQRQAARCV
jgi:hypothetical protein